MRRSSMKHFAKPLRGAIYAVFVKEALFLCWTSSPRLIGCVHVTEADACGQRERKTKNRFSPPFSFSNEEGPTSSLEGSPSTRNEPQCNKFLLTTCAASFHQMFTFPSETLKTDSNNATATNRSTKLHWVSSTSTQPYLFDARHVLEFLA